VKVLGPVVVPFKTGTDDIADDCTDNVRKPPFYITCLRYDGGIYPEKIKKTKFDYQDSRNNH
ncbi:hypothetical protein, partial [uncultured Phocaeicola sp.]